MPSFVSLESGIGRPKEPRSACRAEAKVHNPRGNSTYMKDTYAGSEEEIDDDEYGRQRRRKKRGQEGLGRQGKKDERVGREELSGFMDMEAASDSPE